MDGRDELKEAVQRAADADTSLAAVVRAQLKDMQARLLVLELLTQLRIADEKRRNPGYRAEILKRLDEMVGQGTSAGGWISAETIKAAREALHKLFPEQDSHRGN